MVSNSLFEQIKKRKFLEVFYQLLGFPEELWPEVKSWSERLMRTDMRERDGKVFREFFAANLG